MTGFLIKHPKLRAGYISLSASRFISTEDMKQTLTLISTSNIFSHLGGFAPNTFSRITKYDLDGWLGVAGGPLEYIENSIKSIKGQASRVNKNPNNFQIIILAYPNVIEGKSSKNDENRFPFSGSINEIGSEIQRVNDMGVDHIVFGYNFLPIGRDVDKMINLSKELSKFAR